MRLLSVLPLLAASFTVGQTPSGAEPPHAAATTAADGSPTVSAAYVEYLQGLALAEDGSKPEALKQFAKSLRLQPHNNPSAALVFQLLIEQRTPSRLMLQGHTGPIVFVAYSPDGQKIVTTSADGTSRLWSSRTGQALAPPMHQQGSVLTAAFSADGKHLATGSSEDTAQVWSTLTGKPETPPLPLNGNVQCVAFSPDGTIVAAGTDDGKLGLWDAATGHPLAPPVVYHEAVYELSFSPDGKTLLAATGDGFADVLDPHTGKRTGHPLRQRNIVFVAEYSPDGNAILTASADHSAVLWRARTGEGTGVTLVHGASVDAAAFNGDGSLVLTTSWDHTGRVWNAHTGDAVTPPLQHSEAVLKGAFSPDSNFAATVSRDRTVKLWNAHTGDPVHAPIRSSDGSPGLAFQPHSRSLLVVLGNAAQIVDLPPVEDAPPWLADLAVFAAVQVKYDQRQQPDLAKAHDLHDRLTISHATDSWTRFGQWYFTEAALRPVSPWSNLPLKQYVDLLIANGNPASLELARQLSFDQPAWQLKISPLLAEQRDAKEDRK